MVSSLCCRARKSAKEESEERPDRSRHAATEWRAQNSALVGFPEVCNILLEVGPLLSHPPRIEKAPGHPLDGVSQDGTVTSKRWSACDGDAMPEPVVAYIRVSTARQGRSGLGLEAQQAAIGRFCETEGFEVVAEHVEVETGKATDALDRRPELAKALTEAKRRKCAVLVAKLELSRDVAFISGLMAQRVPLIVATASRRYGQR